MPDPETLKEQDKRLKWVVIRFVAAIAVVVALVVWISIRESGTADEIKEALIENCSTSPVRITLQEILREEIDGNSKRSSPETNQTKEKRIDQLEPEECAKKYK